MSKHTYDIDRIKSRFEQCLGKETSDLVFKTLWLVYKIDDKVIVSNPALFEEKVRKMLGAHTADLVLKSV